MRLYFFDKTTSEKRYLNIVASTRHELSTKLGHYNFYLDNKPYPTYNVNEVFAEKVSTNSIPGAIIGGLVGLLLGPEGVIAGAAIGGAIGFGTDSDENKRVNIFNNS